SRAAVSRSAAPASAAWSTISLTAWLACMEVIVARPQLFLKSKCCARDNCRARRRIGFPAMDLAQLDHRHVWHPFTQQQGWGEEAPLMIERGEGVYLFDTEGRRYIDGTASLWCNVHGHRHPAIDRAIHEQVDRISHSTMLGLSHPGATELAGRLVGIAP